MHRVGLALGVLVGALCVTSCGGCEPGAPDAGLRDGGERGDAPYIFTPRWAFEPWISKDISDGPDTYDFVDGFVSRDIPVGVVVLDSPWETNYNTFVPNPERYPDFGQMVSDLRAQDIRTVLWVTQMINESSFDLEQGGDVYDRPSPNLREASLNDYLVNDGETYLWWKGYGAGLDFFHEDAVAWWRAQQQPLYDMGIAGWKLDFGEEYILTDTVKTAVGEVPHQEYSEAYYRDFWEAGLEALGPEEFVTMVRPYDESYGFEPRFYARPEHSPVLWVGDQYRNWEGLSDALDHIFRSAAEGYVVLGSDIGGYLDNDVTQEIPFDAEVLFRWTAASGLMPFFQLHGRANLEPWNIPERADEFVDAYRYWATLHHQLVPFFFSLAEEGYGEDRSPPFTPILHPLGELEDWAGDYRFLVGDAFLVAPILDETGQRDVELPAGRFASWFSPDSDPVEGEQTLADVTPPSSLQIPVYLKQGAIVPLHVDSEVTGLGPALAPDALTVIAWPGPAQTEFVLHHEEAGKVSITASADEGLTLPDVDDPWIAQIRAEARPSAVTLDGEELTEVSSAADLDDESAAWAWDAARRVAMARVPDGDGPRQVGILE